MKNKELNLKEWKTKHPRFTAIVKISETNPEMGTIILQGSNESGIKREFISNYKDKKGYILY